MSTLSELLPSGGNQNEVEFVASGTLPNGQAVVLKADGTVEVVAIISTVKSVAIPAGSTYTFHSTSMLRPTLAWDKNTPNTIVLIYADSGNSLYGTAIIGKVAGTTISFGAEYVFVSSSSPAYTSVKYDPNQAGKFVIAYVSDSQGRTILGTVSGTSITFSSPASFISQNMSHVKLSFDPNTTGRFVVSYLTVSPDRVATVISGLLSGTSFTFGTQVALDSNSSVNGLGGLEYDPNTAGKFVAAFTDHGSSYFGKAIVGTVSGSSISLGSVATFRSYGGDSNAISFDPTTANSFLISWEGYSPSGVYLKIGTISGTSISFSSEVTVTTASSTEAVSVKYNPNTTTGVFIVQYQQSSAQKIAVCSRSGSSITIGTTYTFVGSYSNQAEVAFDPNVSGNGKFITSYKDITNAGQSVVGQLAATALVPNVADFIGITSAAITSGASGDIVLKGGIAASVANTPLLQVYGSEAAANSSNSYYVNTSYDPNNANKFVVVWMDAGNSTHGKAVVGTVSGTSISYGTVVTWNAAATGYVSNCAFDPNTANKFVIAFQDDSNSGQGTAIVGTISGTSLSFGSKYVFNAANTSYPAISFDPNTAGKFVVAFGATGKSVVGTVSGTSISYGTVVDFNALTSYISISFDPNTANKFIICNRDLSNANYGKVIVGTISGTSLSYGTEATFYPNSITQMVAAYDPSQANKVVIIYRNDFASDVGVALVGTVSGTSISYGTAVVFNNASTNALNLAFKKTGSNFIITYADNGNSSYGTSIMGTLSGTDVTFKEEVVFNSGSVEYTSISFDDNNSGKYVVAYRDTANSSYPTAISGNLSSAMTIGSDYYVQADGTVSTVTTSPAVKAGTAISATTLNLMDQL